MATSTAPAGIRTIPAPPDGFDPRAASELELRRYGLPRRPDPAVRPDLAASYSMINITQGTHTGWRYFSAPGSTTSLENQVEWVLERPFVGGAQAQLPNFGEIYFDSAVGGEGLENVVQAGQDTVINMTENGNVVATTTVETPTLIKIAYTGS